MTITDQPQQGQHVAGRKGRKRKMIIVSAVAGAVLVPLGAWAAVQLFGFGRLEAEAATTQNLTVDNGSVKLTGKLLPGKTVGVEAMVTNPNDFAVTVTGVVMQQVSLRVTPNNAACRNSVHAVGTPGSWPGTGNNNGIVQTIAAPVTIAAGQSALVTVPEAVRQDAEATVLCGVQAEFAVRAENS